MASSRSYLSEFSAERRIVRLTKFEMKDALTNHAPGVPRLRGMAPEPGWACTRCPTTFDSSSEAKSAIRSAGTPQLGCRIDEGFLRIKFREQTLWP